MKSIQLTAPQARKIIIHAAGLAKKGQFGKGREAVYKLIDHLGFIQIDTNYVVERAHHHAIAARIPDYRQEWLEELMEDGRIFEFLTYATGYIPMKDYRFSLPGKESALEKRKELEPQEISMMNRVLDRISREGPLMVKDFENDRQAASNGWWDWRPSKMALERLYMDGRLMITRKKDFQKVFDLPMNLLPADTDTTMPTPEAYARHEILRTLQSLGIAYVKEMSWRARRVRDNRIKSELQKMVDEGKVCVVTIEGRKTAPLYMLPSYLKKKIELSGEVFILSPFDTLNIYRHRLRDFFDFDYQVECFVPEPKRKYGYFSLPVLIGDQFVARMDAKADRKNKILTIHNLHFEPGKLTGPTIDKMAAAISEFAVFNQCQEVVLSKSNNKQAAKQLKQSF